MHGMIILDPKPGWANSLYGELRPGAHVIVVGGHDDGIEARRAGFEIRDALLLLREGASFGFVLRKPLDALNVAEHALVHNTCVMWIDGCRVATTDNLNGGTYSNHLGRLRAAMRPGDDRDEVAGGSYAKRADREFVQPSGRWPANLLLVHMEGCRQEGSDAICAHGCPIAVLDGQGEDSGRASRFYPQAQDRAALSAWLERLLFGPKHDTPSS